MGQMSPSSIFGEGDGTDVPQRHLWGMGGTILVILSSIAFAEKHATYM